MTPERMSGYTGAIFEEEVFGNSGVQAGGYLPFRESVSLVLEHQDGQPKTDQTIQLRKLVAKYMGLGDPTELLFYTAVGSPLDKYHSVDGFFMFGNRKITIDLTMSSKKEQYRADFVINADELDNEGLIDLKAKMIAEAIKKPPQSVVYKTIPNQYPTKS